MNRRDFFRLAVRGEERVLELSCEHLYVQWADAGSAAARGAGGDAGAAADSDEAWVGEPPTRVRVPSVADFLCDLDRRLAEVRVLRVVGREWLAADELRGAVDARIAAFRARGGRVE